MIQLTFKLLKLLSARPLLSISFLVASGFLSGLLEILGIGLILPILSILLHPDLLETNSLIAPLYHSLPFHSVNLFIAFLCALFLFFIVAKNLYLIFYSYSTKSILERWRTRLSTKLFERYLNAPYPFFLKRTQGNFTYSINQAIDTTFNSFLSGLLSFIPQFILLLLLGIIVVIVFFPSMLIVSLWLTFWVFVQYKFSKNKIVNISKEAIKAYTQQQKNIQEPLRIIKETKITHTEDFFLKKFNKTSKEFSKTIKWQTFLVELPTPILEIIFLSALAFLLFFILKFEHLDTKDLLARLGLLVAAVFRLIPSISKISVAINTIKGSLVGVKSVLQDFSELSKPKPRMFKPEKSISKEIQFKDVSYLFPDQKTWALEEINFILKRGDFVGVVGHSGAGKTTLCNLILGLQNPTKGEILLDGKALSESSLFNFQMGLGYVPQESIILSDSLKRNIALGIEDDKIDEKRVLELLSLVCLDDWVKNLKEHLDTQLGEGGLQISGGQRQRLSLARALYRKPHTLILDEATSALDVITENEINQAIDYLRQKEKTTVIAIAHRLSTLKSSNYLIYLENGRIKDQGTFETLSKKHPDFKKMVELSSISKVSHSSLD